VAPPLFEEVARQRLEGVNNATISREENFKYTADFETSQLSDVLITTIVGMVDVFGHLQLPTWLRSSAVDALSAEDATPQQKADALRTILSSTGQVLLLITFTAVVWHIGSALAYCVGILLWPLMLPLKIVKWLCG
jgi:hypothetical protein